MSMMSLAQLVTAEGGKYAEPPFELPIPALSYGVITLSIFLALLGLLWMFRNMAHTLVYGHDGQPVTSSGAGTRVKPGTKGHGMPHGGDH